MHADEAISNWTPFILTHAQKLVITTISGLIAAGVGVAILASKRVFTVTKEDIEIELLIVLCLVCMVTMTTWTHYYVWMISGFAYALKRTGGNEFGQPIRWALAASFALSAPIVFLSDQISSGSFGPFWNIVCSHVLFGSILLIAILSKLRSASANTSFDPCGSARA